jgi:multidrug efflux system membrane fusion protein
MPRSRHGAGPGPHVGPASTRGNSHATIWADRRRLGGASLGVWHWLDQPAAERAPTPASAAIPVQAAAASNADVPIYETGLGNVQAFNTVTVKVRVDGELQKVAFTEGKTVKPGEVLAQIDPRPFQAQLDQAAAKKAQDAALLDNAKLDLRRFQDQSRARRRARASGQCD